MVHPHLGSARITYPRGVTVSSADPMTTGALPPRLLAVPGVVSRPIRIGAMAYYPNLGDATTTDLLGSVSIVPTWVWWGGAGLLALLLVGGLAGGRRTPTAPRVRTVTRTTY